MNSNYEKLMESAELAQLVKEFLARGGQIEMCPYMEPTPEQIKECGFMRRF